MGYIHEFPADEKGHNYVAFKEAAWGDGTLVMKPGWYDCNGHHSRPAAEMWPEYFLQAITNALQVGFVTESQVKEAVKAARP